LNNPLNFLFSTTQTQLLSKKKKKTHPHRYLHNLMKLNLLSHFNQLIIITLVIKVLWFKIGPNFVGFTCECQHVKITINNYFSKFIVHGYHYQLFVVDRLLSIDLLLTSI
jgi:hypothetical protein